MKYLIAVIAAVLLLSGCGKDGIDGHPTYFQKDFTMEDGRVVECVVFQSIQEGGLSCDWANAERSSDG